MNTRRWVRGVRLFLGFLLAPAIVPVSIWLAAGKVLADFESRPGAHVNAPAMVVLFVILFGVGFVMVYFGTLCLGLPYVIRLIQKGQLSFRNIMVVVLPLSLVYAGIVYVALSPMIPRDPLAWFVAMCSIPAVIMSGLCFYLISVWRPLGRDA